MIIVKDQWTAFVANFVRMSSNSFKKNYTCVTEAGKTCKSYLSTQSTCWKSITLNDVFNSKVVGLYNLY